MKKTLTTYLSCLLAGGLLLGACSRPVAYFQRSSVGQRATLPVAQPTVMALTAAAPVAAVGQAPINSLASTSSTATVDQLEAYVRNDAKLATSKTLIKRIDHIKSMVVASSIGHNQTQATTQHKATVLEKLMTKKVNAKINKHLSPNQPQKPMINGGLLGGSLVLVIVGLLLLLLTTGTVATIGLIAAVIGAIGVIFGLLAS